MIPRCMSLLYLQPAFFLAMHLCINVERAVSGLFV